MTKKTLLLLLLLLLLQRLLVFASILVLRRGGRVRLAAGDAPGPGVHFGYELEEAVSAAAVTNAKQIVFPIAGGEVFVRYCT